MKKEDLKKAYKAACDVYYKAGLDNMNKLRMSTIKEVLLDAAREAYGLKVDHWWGYVDQGEIENISYFCADDVFDYLADKYDENHEGGDTAEFEIVLLDGDDQIVERITREYTVEANISDAEEHGTWNKTGTGCY